MQAGETGCEATRATQFLAGTNRSLLAASPGAPRNRHHGGRRQDAGRRLGIANGRGNLQRHANRQPVRALQHVPIGRKQFRIPIRSPQYRRASDDRVSPS